MVGLQEMRLAPQNTMIECELRAGKIVKLEVTPAARRKDVEILGPSFVACAVHIGAEDEAKDKVWRASLTSSFYFVFQLCLFEPVVRCRQARSPIRAK